jgi:flavin-dependent dehydrogenase
MLLGDAAGLVDPLTREGIYFALLSGQWAAEALATVPAARASARYADRVMNEIHPELARAARLSRMFFAPAFSDQLVRALDESEEIRGVFVDLVGGVQPYRGLRRRLLATCQWSLALSVIRLLLGQRFASTMTAVELPREIQQGVRHGSDRFA